MVDSWGYKLLSYVSGAISGGIIENIYLNMGISLFADRIQTTAQVFFAVKNYQIDGDQWT